jgi:gamma-glutamyl:cysteine ligase YbdK (ATP-grasp superfamily)
VNEHDAIERIKRLSHSINCADEIAEVIERLIKERDEARQQIRDIIQRKEAQMLSIIEEGNGVARILDCYKEDSK